MRPWLVFTGIAHGVSSLGGPLVLMLAAARHPHRAEMRTMLATAFVGFAVAQLAVLGLLSPHLFGWHALASPAVAAGTFLWFGDRLFHGVTAHRFNALLTALAAVYACLLAARAFGV
jgi:uncharacterized membrane protein YfcA